MSAVAAAGGESGKGEGGGGGGGGGHGRGYGYGGRGNGDWGEVDYGAEAEGHTPNVIAKSNKSGRLWSLKVRTSVLGVDMCTGAHLYLHLCFT